MKKNRVDVITMGCSKNLVDSEHLMRQLQECGYEVVHDSEEPCGEIAVINTCGFIGDAKQEAIDNIIELGQLKQNGTLKKIIVTVVAVLTAGTAFAQSQISREELIQMETQQTILLLREILP